MIDRVPYEKRYKYPHFESSHVILWEKFIEQNPRAYTEVQYDLHVGDPPQFNPLLDDGTDINQDALYRFKIDVVGYYNGGVDIIEIKPNAGASAIGQVEGYKDLFIRDEKPKGKIGMVIITDKINQNMDYLCKRKGVTLIKI